MLSNFRFVIQVNKTFKINSKFFIISWHTKTSETSRNMCKDKQECRWYLKNTYKIQRPNMYFQTSRPQVARAPREFKFHRLPWRHFCWRTGKTRSQTRSFWLLITSRSQNIYKHKKINMAYLTYNKYFLTIILQYFCLLIDVGINSFSTFARANPANMIILFV